MLDDAILAYASDWKVDHRSVREWAIVDVTNRDARIKELFGAFGVPVEAYHHHELPSWGVLIPEDSEIVVEYKLRHSGADVR